MRKIVILFPLLFCASPAFAQASPKLPPELTDPAAIQRLTTTMQALSHALMDVRIGGVEAALQGREATSAEKRQTLGDIARRNDPQFDRHMQQQIASVGPQIQRSVQAINRALPEMIKSVEGAQKALDRAIANMPDPTYPKR
jgi:hypothetical protein